MLIEGSPNVFVGGPNAGSGGRDGGGGGSGGGGGGGGSGGGGGGGGGKKLPEEKSFIEIELVDEEGQPVAAEAYRVTAADGEVFEGQLDSRGTARVDNIKPGTCQVVFPGLDARDVRRG